MSETTPPPKGLLSRQAAADEVGCSLAEMRKLIDLGLIRAWRVGKNIRVPRAAIAEFLDGGNMAKPS